MPLQRRAMQASTPLARPAPILLSSRLAAVPQRYNLSMSSRTRLKPGRPVTHALLALVALGGAYAIANYAPVFGPGRLLALWYGYLSLLLLAVTLVIGPLALLLRRINNRRPRTTPRNPVNLDLRR